MLLVDDAVRGPLKAAGSELHQTDIITDSAWLPVIMGKSRRHVGVFIPLIAAVLV